MSRIFISAQAFGWLRSKNKNIAYKFCTTDKSAVLCEVTPWKFTDISERRTASIFRVEEQAKQTEPLAPSHCVSGSSELCLAASAAPLGTPHATAAICRANLLIHLRASRSVCGSVSV
jgi:hypothetical protein